MTAVLAIVLAVAPVTIPMPENLDDACDASKLAPMLSAPPQQMPSLLQNIDRRVQITLAEERQLEAQIASNKNAGDEKKGALLAFGVLAVAVLGGAALG